MHGVLVSVAVLTVTAMAAAGVAATAAGRLPMWARRRVLRPRLWGYGVLVSAAGLTAFMFLGPLGGAPLVHTVLPLAGMAAYVVGLFLQMLAQRPGRTP